jgi:pimeloyl-ACP methyl ester carboxylesterase
MVEANGIELCTEAFGDAGDQPVLLIMGLGGSMLWWEDGFCRMLAGGGRFVIRYDHRDTGRSVTYQPGQPGYTGDDLVADAVGVLDAYGLRSAHIAGVSAGGALAQLLALNFPARARTLVLISTSPVGGDRDLPPPSEEFGQFVATARVDWTDTESVSRYLAGYARVLAGGQRPFDERGARDLVLRDIARARCFAARRNHELLEEGRARKPLSSIAVPTLVIHGTADPMFPPGHADALAAEIPAARLLLLEGAGHGVWPHDWETITGAILRHTASAGRSAD